VAAVLVRFGSKGGVEFEPTRELGGAGEAGRVDSEFRGMLLRVLNERGSFTTVERGRWWMSEEEFGMTKKGLVTKSHGNNCPSREDGGRSRRQDREGCVWESAGKEKKRRVGVLNLASWAIAEGGRGGVRCAVAMGAKTAVVDKETCLLSERSARRSRAEDGGEGGRGVRW